MKIAPWLAFGIVAGALGACGAEPPPAAKAPLVPERPRDRLSYATIPPSAPSKYPLTTCVISGKELATLGHKPYAIAYKGYEMQFCSENCLDQFASDPEGYVRKMNPKAMFERK